MAEATHSIKPDFLIIPYNLFENENLEAIDRTVYGVVYWFEHMKDGVCKASNETIARIARIEPRSVKNALARLEEEGYVERIYKDDSRRNRLGIICKVAFKYADSKRTREQPYPRRGNSRTLAREPRMTRIGIENSNIDKEGINTAGKTGNGVGLFIDEFKHVNPSHSRLFANKTQRGAAERLIEKYGLDKAMKLVKYLATIHGKPYAPSITTPYELEAKLAKVVEYAKKEEKRGPKLVTI